MASGIFAVLDDIAALMDDVAVASKVATQKAAGILGDDLAVNAEKATGFLSSRELPVLWKITKGSFVNKLILVPLAFLLNVYLPIAMTVALVIGGFYLAFEGVEKIVEFLFHRHDKQQKSQSDVSNLSDAEKEKAKVKSAISTDFILSVEIVIIALSAVLDQPLNIQIIAVSITAIAATIGVYGFVALIVRMDDFGFRLIRRSHGKGFLNKIGRVLVKALPYIIKLFSIVGTIALLLVSGGIFAHYLPFLHNFLQSLPEIIRNFVFGAIAGTGVVVVITVFKKLLSVFKKKQS